jgi:hypothetical protein
MLAVAAAIVVSATAHAGPAGGTCVDVTVGSTTIADTICPPRADLAVRTLSAGDYTNTTVYFGAIKHRAKRVRLTFARRTVTARVTKGRVYAAAVRGTPPLGAIAVGSRERDVDPFGLPPVGRRMTLLKLTDEQDRSVRLVAAAPRVLSGSKRKKALCTGLQLADAPSPSRAVCVVKPSRLDMRFSAECKKRHQLVFGIAPASIVKATAVLDDGSTGRLTVTKVPRRVKRPGVAITGRFSGALAKRVRVYGRSGAQLGAAALEGGCASSNTRS